MYFANRISCSYPKVVLRHILAGRTCQLWLGGRGWGRAKLGARWWDGPAPNSVGTASRERHMLHWLVLIGSGLFEAVWATALSKSEGFTKLVPTLVFAVSVTVSMGGLAFAMREIPVGTGYAIWVAVGAVTTVGWAMATGAEPISLLRIAFIVGIVGCVIGLKLTTH